MSVLFPALVWGRQYKTTTIRFACAFKYLNETSAFKLNAGKGNHLIVLTNFHNYSHSKTSLSECYSKPEFLGYTTGH